MKTKVQVENKILIIYEMKSNPPEKDGSEADNSADRLLGFGQKKAQAIIQNIEAIKKFAETGAILLALFIFSSCARECSVMCYQTEKNGPQDCSARFEEAYRLQNWNRLDGMSPKEANQFCIDYTGVNKK